MRLRDAFMRLLRRLGRNDTFLLRLLRDDILLLRRRRRRRLLRKHRRRVGNTSVGGSKTHGFFLPFLFSSALFVMLVQIEESRAFRCGAAAWLLFLFVSLVLVVALTLLQKPLNPNPSPSRCSRKGIKKTTRPKKNKNSFLFEKESGFRCFIILLHHS